MVYSSILQYTTIYYSILQYTPVHYNILQYTPVHYNILQYITVPLFGPYATRHDQARLASSSSHGLQSPWYTWQTSSGNTCPKNLQAMREKTTFSYKHSHVSDHSSLPMVKKKNLPKSLSYQQQDPAHDFIAKLSLSMCNHSSCLGWRNVTTCDLWHLALVRT